VPLRLQVWSGRAATERAWLAPRRMADITDIEEFLDHAPPVALRSVHAITALMIVALIAIAAMARFDVVVTGAGRLTADAPTVVVQPMQLSIIRDIRVKAGDVVHRGDILATLDPTFARADLDALRARHRALAAEIWRLESELNGVTPAGADGDADRDLQLALYWRRQSQYGAQLADFAQKIDSYKASLAAAEESRASLVQQAGLARDMQDMRKRLYDLQSGSRLNYLSAQLDYLRVARELQAETARIAELQFQLRSEQAERQAFIETWHRDLLEQIVRTRTDNATVSDSLTKAQRLEDLVELTAPQDAVVLEVAKRSVGSVLHEAEPLVTLVPSDAPLIADVSVSSADIGYAQVGDRAVIKVDAFPFQGHGMAKGWLRSISEDSYASSPADASPQLYHRVQIALDDVRLTDLPEGARLIPGMSVNAEIEVGSRSLISFLLYPIIRGVRESLREP
jgi:HlyD family secretion protein